MNKPYSLILNTTFTLLACTSSFASNASEKSTVQSILKCDAISQSNERLTCFNQIASQIKQNIDNPTKVTAVPTIDLVKESSADATTVLSQATKPEVAKQTAPVPDITSKIKVADNKQPEYVEQAKATVVKNPEQLEKAFGVEHKVVNKNSIEKIFSVVSKVTDDRLRGKSILLENGQLWKQQDNLSFNVRKEDKIYIERGILDGFFMGKEGIKSRVKVARIN
jgi:hypothetical protein